MAFVAVQALIGLDLNLSPRKPGSVELDFIVNWQVYMIVCTDESLYTGISTDAARRFVQHAAGTGAKYFRGHTPIRLVYLEEEHDRGTASRREAEIKKLRPVEKRRLLTSALNRLKS